MSLAVQLVCNAKVPDVLWLSTVFSLQGLGFLVHSLVSKIIYLKILESNLWPFICTRPWSPWLHPKVTGTFVSSLLFFHLSNNQGGLSRGNSIRSISNGFLRFLLSSVLGGQQGDRWQPIGWPQPDSLWEDGKREMAEATAHSESTDEVLLGEVDPLQRCSPGIR